LKRRQGINISVKERLNDKGIAANGRAERSPGRIAGQPRAYKKKISPRYSDQNTHFDPNFEEVKEKFVEI